MKGPDCDSIRPRRAEAQKSKEQSPGGIGYVQARAAWPDLRSIGARGMGRHKYRASKEEEGPGKQPGGGRLDQSRRRERLGGRWAGADTGRRRFQAQCGVAANRNIAAGGRGRSAGGGGGCGPRSGVARRAGSDSASPPAAEGGRAGSQKLAVGAGGGGEGEGKAAAVGRSRSSPPFRGVDPAVLGARHIGSRLRVAAESDRSSRERKRGRGGARRERRREGPRAAAPVPRAPGRAGRVQRLRDADIHFVRSGLAGDGEQEEQSDGEGRHVERGYLCETQPLPSTDCTSGHLRLEVRAYPYFRGSRPAAECTRAPRASGSHP